MENAPTLGPKRFKFLDYVKHVAGVDTDAALSHLLELSPAALSKLRNERRPIGPAILVRIHEVTDISIRDLKHLAGQPCLSSLKGPDAMRYAPSNEAPAK